MPSTTVPASFHVLVVDDNAEVRAMIAALLVEEGLRATEAAGPDEAMQLVNARRFDAAVVDFTMEGTTGLLLVARFRGLGNGRDIPVVLLNSLPPGRPRDAAREQVSHFACIEILDKPVTGRRLAAALGELLAVA
jgi:two-component system OmpR family response regulator